MANRKSLMLVSSGAVTPDEAAFLNFHDIVLELDRLARLRAELERSLLACKYYDHAEPRKLPSKAEVEQTVRTVNDGTRDAMQKLEEICGDPFRTASRSNIANRLAGMIGIIPNVNPHSPEVYIKGLVKYVLKEKPGVVVLESACCAIEAKSTFQPSIPEIVEMICKHRERWDRRLQFSEDVCDGEVSTLGRELIAAIEKIEFEREERERKRKLWNDDVAALAPEVLQFLCGGGGMREQVYYYFDDHPLCERHGSHRHILIFQALLQLQREGNATCYSDEWDATQKGVETWTEWRHEQRREETDA